MLIIKELSRSETNFSKELTPSKIHFQQNQKRNRIVDLPFLTDIYSETCPLHLPRDLFFFRVSSGRNQIVLGPGLDPTVSLVNTKVVYENKGVMKEVRDSTESPFV